MEYADKRGAGASVGVRKSLRHFKSTPAYRDMLKRTAERRETPSMTDIERRRLRLDSIIAREELEQLKRGKSLSEFCGLLTLRDPMDGLHDGEGYE